MAPVTANLVSTIVPVHNRPKLLHEAISSVLAQTYRPIEVIIVDDGSNDDTPMIADQLAFAHSDKVRVIHQMNRGAGMAREAGRQLARGEFIQYLDSDDILLPHKFERQICALRNHPDCAVAYGRTAFVAQDGDEARGPWKRTGEQIDAMFPSFLMSRWWGTSTPLYRRSICDAAGPWLDLLNEEDWEYDCRIAMHGAKLCQVDDFVSEEREHGGPRLSRGGTREPAKLRDRASAHGYILEHAILAGITQEAPEMQHFSRALFLLARQCGAAGLGVESRRLFILAQTAAGARRARGVDFVLYAATASVLGWTRTARLACWTDGWRA